MNIPEVGSNLERSNLELALDWIKDAREHLLGDDGADADERSYFAESLEIAWAVAPLLEDFTNELARLQRRRTSSVLGIDMIGLQLLFVSQHVRDIRAIAEEYRS